MAEFIAKLGLDAKEFVSGMEAAAQKAGMIGKAMTDSASDSKKLSDGLKSASAEADGLAKSTKEIDANLQKAGSSGGALDGLTSKFKEGQAAASAGGGMFGEVANKLGQLATPAGAATAAIGVLTAGIAASVTIGQEFQQSLAGVSAVTGLTGPALDDIGNRARELAKRFGGEASTQLSAFQGVLSKFGAQLAQTPEELGKVSENINILAKAGGLDAQQAMDTLANSMLQFGVNVSDGAEAAAESSRYINVLAASARVGAAEIPQVGEAVLVAGVAAKQSKVSFEETNAAIQVLAAGGKVGAEAGTALRNVLGKIAGEDVIPKDALAKLKSLGVDMSVVSNTSLSFSDRMKELSKASGDATAFAQVFGTENAAAASILANGAGTIADWTAQITGTQDATTQAAVNMNTFGEQMNRAQAYVEDLAISLFNAFAPAVTAVIGYIMDFAGVVGTAIGGLWSFVQPLIMPLLEFFNLHLIVAFNLVKSVVTGFVAAAQDAFARFQVVIEPLRQALSGLFGKASEGTSIMDSLKVVFETVAKVAQAVFSVALGVVVKYIEGVVFILTKLVALVKDGISFITGIATAVQDWATNLLKTNETIGFVVGNVQKFIDGIIKLKDQLLSILGIGGQEVKVTAKVETKPEDTKKQVEDESKKNPAKVSVVADPEAAKKASKAIMDLKKDELQSAIAALKTDQQSLENKIKQQAIDERRKLTDKERVTILNSQLKLNKDIEEATRRVLQVTGEGANIKIGLKLTAADAGDLKTDVIGQLDKLGDEKIKIGLEFVKLTEEQMKAASELIKDAASQIKDNAKESLKLKVFLEDPLDAFARVTSAIQQLRDKSNEAAAIGNKGLSMALANDASGLESRLDTIKREAAAKRAEDDKKNAEKEAKEREQNNLDIVKLFERKIEEEKLASAKRVAENTEMLNALKREEDALTASLKNRELSYEEFSTKLVDIEARRAAAQATIQEEQTSAFSQTMNGALAATNEVLASELAKMSAGFDAEFTKQAEAGTVSLETLGSAAAAQFGAMVISGQSAGNALKDVSANVVGKLIDMYVAPVILSTISFLGPLALPVATALVASAKSLFASAVAGFQDGGYTGDGGPSQIAGVVHGQEFVHTADVTRKHRGLFEHLHKGGELSSWMVTTAGALQAPAVAAPQLNTYGIESRLDRLEMAINRGNRKFESMRAVQMTVEHDPSLTIKAQSRNLEIRSARS